MTAKRWFLVFLGLMGLLIGLEVARIYFIMPFPGSQLGFDEAEWESLGRVKFAYWMHQHIGWLRFVGWVLIAYPAFLLISQPTTRGLRYAMGGLLVGYAGVWYVVNQQMMADRLFLQPTPKRLATMQTNTVPLNKLVVGFAANGQATAYPIQLIGYHHQVRDTVGGQPIMVTYCTVCRTGRVFSPLVQGQADEFRLVGMDHFNAMFEDKRTGSWWRQATGEAVAGPLRGKGLLELSARHVTLRQWAIDHPNTRVLQPDSRFADEFDRMKGYDRGGSTSKLTRRDSASWRPKSWVVGIERAGFAKAYDWNRLQTNRIIDDVLGGEPLLVAIAPDSLSFGVWSRRVGIQTLDFQYANRQLIDSQTHSVWNWQGRCLAGPLAGRHLADLPKAHQEFWHSWRSFHPQTKY